MKGKKTAYRLLSLIIAFTMAISSSAITAIASETSDKAQLKFNNGEFKILILSDIQDGTFAKDFLLDMSSAGGQVHFNAMRKLASEHPSEAVGADIRKLYSWSDEDKLINNWFG